VAANRGARLADEPIERRVERLDEGELPNRDGRNDFADGAFGQQLAQGLDFRKLGQRGDLTTFEAILARVRRARCLQTSTFGSQGH
jgi:hypothetical protein